MLKQTRVDLTRPGPTVTLPAKTHEITECRSYVDDPEALVAALGERLR